MIQRTFVVTWRPAVFRLYWTNSWLRERYEVRAIEAEVRVNAGVRVARAWVNASHDRDPARAQHRRSVGHRRTRNVTVTRSPTRRSPIGAVMPNVEAAGS